jgi:cytochrome c-type biogenesis protein CcmH
MVFWILLAAIGALAFAWALWPLLRPKGFAGTAADDRAFYQAQLADIERDAARGLIPPAELESARAEAARRLLRAKAAAAAAGAVPSLPMAAQAGVALLVAATGLIALPLYLRAGAPSRPDMPRAERVAAAEAAVKVETREGVQKIFALLENDPRNPILLEFLVPHFLQARRYEQAAQALTVIVEEFGPSAKRLTDLAAARGAAARAKGQLDPEVRQLLEKALELDPSYLIARFNLGLAKVEAGDRAGGLADLRIVEAGLPKAAPVRPTLLRIIKEIEAAPEPDQATPRGGEAIAALPPQEREQAIRNMVASLDQRLTADGGKIEDWLRLIRSYVVLKDAEKARGALGRARVAFAGKPAELTQLDELAKALELTK